MLLRRIAVGVAVCAVLVASAREAVAAESNNEWPPTDLATLVARPNTVVFLGHLENAKRRDKGDTTDFVINKILKGPKTLADKKVITIERYIKIPDLKKPPKVLAIGEVKNGEVELFRAYPDTPALVAYVEGALKIDAPDRAKLLRYAFDHLSHEDESVADDALDLFRRRTNRGSMFPNPTDTTFRKTAKTLPPEKLRKWLTSEEPIRSSDHKGVYGFLLGHCRASEDAALLRKLLDKESGTTACEGLFTGYLLLDKKGGYEYLMKRISGEKEEYGLRVAGLYTLLYFWADGAEVLTKKQILDGMLALLAHANTADESIDYLRRWKVWELTPQILRLATLESHAMFTAVQQAILKFALAAIRDDPKNKEAVAFVQKSRKDDPERFDRVEGELKEEMERFMPAVAPPPRSREPGK